MNKLLTLLITSAMALSAATFNVSTTPELRTALNDAATNGEDDTIVLADGTYKTTDDGGGTFIYLSNENNNLTLIGSSSENVILSGDNQHQIFNHNSTLDAHLKLEKLSFVDGNNTITQRGGGVYTDYNLDVINCDFTNNSADNGAGIYTTSSLEVTDCKFTNNSANSSGGGFYSYNSGGVTKVNNSTFTNNTATGRYGGGGGFYSAESKTIVENSIFINNKADWDEVNPTAFGGGFRASDVTVINSIFKGNVADYGFGGGFYSSDATVTNSIFTDNNASKGGAFNTYYLPSTISNSLIIGNSTGVSLSGENNKIVNSIFYNNGIDLDGGSIEYLENNYIDLSKVTVINFPSNNIFDGVTLGFVDEANGDYNLTASSDLIDAGTTIITGLTVPTTDLNGNLRIIGTSVDIGPYEFSTTRPTINSVSYTGTTQEQQELTFTTDSNASAGRSISSVEYDYLNDGTFTTTNTYTCQTAGTYTVNIKVTDSEGEFSSITKTITIAELAFANMTDEQKLLKAIDPTYYNEIIAIIDAEKSTSNASGVTTGENNVVLDPNTYGLVTKSDVELTASSISGLSTGWTLTSTPFTITDLSMFDTATIIWVYNNSSASWSAYSSDTTMRQKIIDSTEVELLTTIPAGSGVWINK